MFIDESGSFAVQSGGGRSRPSVSCIGALVVPEARYDAIKEAFTELSQPWPKERGEVKGRLLGEEEIAAAIRLCADYGVNFECVAIDLGLHQSQEILQHKEAQARKLTASLTPQHQESLVKETIHYQRVLRSISLPEYVQMTLLTRLIHNIMETQVCWFARFDPGEIGAFRWTLDAKDAKAKSLHRMERLWQVLSLPFLESQSLREPSIQITGEGFDYSAFERFSIHEGHPADYLRPYAQHWVPGTPFDGDDIRLIMTEYQQFANSADVIGLQMVDVMTNAARRMLSGNLQPSGWKDFGRIMVKPLRDQEVIRMLSLHPRPRHWRPSAPYNQPLKWLRGSAKSLLRD